MTFAPPAMFRRLWAPANYVAVGAIFASLMVPALDNQRVKDAFELESRGMITVKGKGELAAWFVSGPRRRTPGTLTR